jgi:hypothetical protein
MNSDDVRRVPDDEVDGEEGWDRLTDDPEVRRVEALRWHGASEWPWQVTIWAAEFVREEPLESEFRRTIDAALRAVPGVTNVTEEDREIWTVAGSPSGEGLVRAAADAVDSIADRIRAHIEALGEEDYGPPDGDATPGPILP